jgi:hypothetical protein
MKKRIAISSLLLIFASGCALPQPTAEEIATADYGEYPARYQEIIKSFISLQLKDPYSAVFQFREPYKGYASQEYTFADGKKTRYGWIVTFSFNAKNSFGAYTGGEVDTFIFRGDNFYPVSVSY